MAIRQHQKLNRLSPECIHIFASTKQGARQSMQSHMVDFVQHGAGLVFSIKSTEVTILFFDMVNYAQCKLRAIQLVAICADSNFERHRVCCISPSGMPEC